MGNMSGSYGSHYTLWQSIIQNSQDIANNKSNITVRMYLSFDGSSYYAYTNNSTSGSMTINGTTHNYSISSIKFSSGQAKDILLATWTGDIAHNTDGTKGISVFGSWNTNTSRIGSGSCSASKTLSTIPRASSITCSTANIESNATVTITSASSTFTHSVYAYFGSQYVIIAENQKGGSIPWTIPTSFYAQIPDDPSGTGTIYCETYNNGTLIGVKTSPFTVTTNIDKCRPTVTGTVVDTNSTTIALTGNANKLVLGKSTAKITVSPVAKNSATIKTVKIDGVTTTNNTRTISNVGKASFPIEVTDSREYPNVAYSVTASGGSVSYVPLTLNAEFFRPQPTTGEVQLTYSGKYFNGSFGAVSNTLSITWKYKVQGASSWTTGGTITPTLSGNTISSKTISLGTSFDYQTAYDFQLIAVDKLTTITRTASVSVGMPVFYWGKDFFDVNVDAKFKKTVDLTAKTLKSLRSFLFTLDAMNASGRFYKLAQIPATNDGNAIQLNIKGFLGNWTGDKATIDLQIHNRDTLKVYGNFYGKSTALSYQRIVIYKESNGSHTVYLYNASSYTGPNALEITWGGFGNIFPTIYTDYQDTTTPTGTHVYSSTTSTLANANGAVSLYDNSSGTSGTVTLSETSANFSYLEIFYSHDASNYGYSSVKVQAPNAKRVCLSQNEGQGSNLAMYAGHILINGTSITFSGGNAISFTSTGAWSGWGASNEIKIYKVIGYR